MSDDSYYFAASTVQPDLFGTPLPAPGRRVQFDRTALAKFGNPRRWPAPLQAPWTRHGLLVYRNPRAVLTWPCRVWRVHRLENPFSSNPETLAWLRCDSFEVIDELPSWQIFGLHGAGVAELIHEAAKLSQEQVDSIAAADGRHEWRIRLSFLDRWRSRQPKGPDLNEPAGWGGLHIGDAVDLAAARTGQHLFGWIEEAGYWPILADPSWREARRAALAMMTAISAPELLQEDEEEVLTSRWKEAQAR